ncbi:MAG: ATP cone domain-containing protein, partial [Salinivirgaceae bacterium]|nr:ATP cone domain-containing protein [Salinivirgaceae bacterium]
QERITSSIFKAAQSVGGDDRERAQSVSNEVVKRLIKKYSSDEEITSEEIFSEVKETLMDMGHGKTAIALDLFVKLKNKLKNIKSLIDADELVRGYIGEEDWRVKENSNMAYSWQGLNNHISSSVQANYWLYSTYPKYIMWKKGDVKCKIKHAFHGFNCRAIQIHCVTNGLKRIKRDSHR